MIIVVNIQMWGGEVTTVVVWFAAQNDHGSGGGVVLMGPTIKGWLLPNNEFKFWQNWYSGCRDMGVSSGGLGEGGGYCENG